MQEINFEKKHVMKKIEDRTNHIKEFNKNLNYFENLDQKLRK